MLILYLPAFCLGINGNRLNHENTLMKRGGCESKPCIQYFDPAEFDPEASTVIKNDLENLDITMDILKKFGYKKGTRERNCLPLPKYR
jgi:hypothetical protein